MDGEAGGDGREADGVAARLRRATWLNVSSAGCAGARRHETMRRRGLVVGGGFGGSKLRVGVGPIAQWRPDGRVRVESVALMLVILLVDVLEVEPLGVFEDLGVYLYSKCVLEA